MAWTEADRAEHDVLLHELVRLTFSHRARCPSCRRGGRSCEAVGEAIDAVLAWRHWRGLRTKAAELRARQDLHDLTIKASERATGEQAA